MTNSRTGLARREVIGSAAAIITGTAGTVAADRDRDDRTESFVLTEDVMTDGEFLYLPFSVPEGVRRVDLELSKSSQGELSVGLGLFDQRGAQYQSDGFRGIYGAERKSCYVTATDAADSFLPGPIEPGTWTAIVPVFNAQTPGTIAVTVTLRYGTAKVSPKSGSRPPEPQSTDAGWYSGDLHTHTPASSDAWASGSALSPAEWAETAGSLGLDFISLTDHNVVSQNQQLGRVMQEQDNNVLLIGGEEMTNWFHGHATITGLAPGEWVDFRQRPAGEPLREHEARIQQLVEAAERVDAYASVAHPMLPINDNEWDFFPDAFDDPAARLDGIEVWSSGLWTPDDEVALRFWDRLLQQGWRITANGGSDTHGTDDPTFGNEPGIPTTHVYAEELSMDGIVAGLKQHRATIADAPDGPRLYLTAQANEQNAMIGGAVTASRTESVTFEATVRDGVGYTLLFIRDGVAIDATTIEQQEQVVTTSQQVGDGGYIRVELRGQPDIRPSDPPRSRGGMKALTNPIFLEATGGVS